MGGGRGALESCAKNHEDSKFLERTFCTIYAKETGLSWSIVKNLGNLLKIVSYSRRSKIYSSYNTNVQANITKNISNEYKVKKETMIPLCSSAQWLILEIQDPNLQI